MVDRIFVSSQLSCGAHSLSHKGALFLIPRHVVSVLGCQVGFIPARWHSAEVRLVGEFAGSRRSGGGGGSLLRPLLRCPGGRSKTQGSYRRFWAIADELPKSSPVRGERWVIPHWRNPVIHDIDCYYRHSQLRLELSPHVRCSLCRVKHGSPIDSVCLLVPPDEHELLLQPTGIGTCKAVGVSCCYGHACAPPMRFVQ